MPARYVVAVLASVAASLIIVAGFLPQVLIREEVAYRAVDFDRPARTWAAALAIVGIQGLLFAISGILVAIRGRSPLAAGILLGVGVPGLTGDLLADFLSDPVFRPGSGMWVSLIACLLAVTAAVVALRLRPRPAEEAPTPPPGDWTTA